MTLPRTVSLTANAVTTVDLAGDISPHSIVRLVPNSSAGIVWATTDSTTPAAYADGTIATWYTPGDSDAADAYVEVPESRLIKLLCATNAQVRIERVPLVSRIRDLDGGFGLSGNAKYPTVTYNAVTTIDLTGVTAPERWIRVDLPLTAEAWATTDGTTPASGTGLISNTTGRFSWGIQMPASRQLKVWLGPASGSGASTRMRVAAILEPRPETMAT